MNKVFATLLVALLTAPVQTPALHDAVGSLSGISADRLPADYVRALRILFGEAQFNRMIRDGKNEILSSLLAEWAANDEDDILLYGHTAGNAIPTPLSAIAPSDWVEEILCGEEAAMPVSRSAGGLRIRSPGMNA